MVLLSTDVDRGLVCGGVGAARRRKYVLQELELIDSKQE